MGMPHLQLNQEFQASLRVLINTKQSKRTKYEMPRLVEGKYLKFVFETLSKSQCLDLAIDKIVEKICPQCDLTPLCENQRTFHKLSPLCLDGATTNSYLRMRYY
jgi:hypothetical protein